MAISKEYIKHCQEWLQWYNWHRSMMKNAPLERKVEFLFKANHGAYVLIAGLADEIIDAPAERKLLLPVEVAWNK